MYDETVKCGSKWSMFRSDLLVRFGFPVHSGLQWEVNFRSKVNVNGRFGNPAVLRILYHSFMDMRG